MGLIKYKSNGSWKNFVLDVIYPIGSIYMNSGVASNDIYEPIYTPANCFGGTWANINQKFLIGTNQDPSTGVFDTVIDSALNYKTGSIAGSLVHSHTYAVQYSDFYASWANDEQFLRLFNSQTGSYQTSSSSANADITINGNATASCVSKTAATYENSARTVEVSNLPPFLMVYMYKRIA